MSTKPKYAYNINVALYGDVTRADWVNAFVSLADKVQHRMGLSYSRFDCGYLEPGQVSPRGKDLRYMKRNMGKIQALLTQPGVYTVEFTAVEIGTDVVRGAECTIRMQLPYPEITIAEPYCRFTLHVVPQVVAAAVREVGSLNLLVEVVRAVEELMDIRYGLVQPLSSEKAGGIYFGIDVLTSTSNQAERDDLETWLRRRNEYHRKVRGVYWGNLLTRDHLGEKRSGVLAEIERVVGEANVVEVTPGKFLFVLPTDILDYMAHQSEFEDCSTRLRRVLSRYGLLMV